MPKGQTRKRSQQKTTGQFKLTHKAADRLTKYFNEIRKGIVNVCEMHTQDDAPSLDQEGFELAYIDKLLGQTATAVSMTIKHMVDGLTKQTEKAYNELIKVVNDLSTRMHEVEKHYDPSVI